MDEKAANDRRLVQSSRAQSENQSPIASGPAHGRDARKLPAGKAYPKEQSSAYKTAEELGAAVKELKAAVAKAEEEHLLVMKKLKETEALMLAEQDSEVAEAEIPRTDSGYESAVIQQSLSKHSVSLLRDVTQEEEQDQRNFSATCGKDAQILEATSLDSISARNYISELSYSIYNGIRNEITVKDWPSLSRSLTELIRAFAIKIGLESRAAANQDVVYFLSKHHR